MNEPSLYDRYKQDRAYTRFARAQQGRTTDLDRAEERYEKLAQQLLLGRFFVPLGICLAVALATGATGLDCFAIVMWALGANFVAVIATVIGTALFGAGFGEFVYNAMMSASGVVLFSIGASLPPPMIIGVVMAVSPTIWWLLSRAMMVNSTYVKLMRATATDDVLPRIIE